MRILYFIPESWPTFRPDIAVLFGKYLAEYGLTVDLATDGDDSGASWNAGRTLFFRAPAGAVPDTPWRFFHTLTVLLRVRTQKYDAVQVRNMPVHAMFALWFCRLTGAQFYYWISFPHSEGQIFRAARRGWTAGFRYFLPMMQGHLGKFLLYKVILKRADHVFVQSARMASDLAERGVPIAKMTAVPMGVDTTLADPEKITGIHDDRLIRKRVVLYLGTFDERPIEVLLEMAAVARRSIPELALVLVGDSYHQSRRDSLHRLAQELGVSDIVVWVGWVSPDLGWRYVRAAEVGVSPVPRGFLLDSSSPTKVFEYMALGVPVLANDSPAVEDIIRESGAGLCVELSGANLGGALVSMLSDKVALKEMAERGRNYVVNSHDYKKLAAETADVYARLLRSDTRPIGK
ncbi:glycosyltransferase [Thiocapsa rosea]|uniref:Glycosyltransferase involved in cell wall biosynthesis n=1 Tax=Thiocapsa rosea TaxID=69360 RepID=A0A495VDH6_9GAMM|nr:glycosyltransferase [Thiocapsa rosea]RKT47451.1 glycosyltransferase involved in cell wall biosynthesis [Thiocapsa rosea]